MTSAVIKKSFAEVGIFPWSVELILKNAKKNIGETCEEKSDQDKLVAEMKKIINETYGDTQEKKRSRRRSFVPAGEKLYAIEDIDAANKAEEEATKQKQKEKEDKKVQQEKVKEERKLQREVKKTAIEGKRCKGPHPNEPKPPLWRKQQAWVWCSTCDVFCLCTKCCIEHKGIMEEHEQVCFA